MSKRLKIQLLSGKDLPAADAGGTSDPYCYFVCGKSQTPKSKYKNKTLNPVWNETFELLIDDQNLPLVLKCYDHDTFSADDFLGESVILLRNLVENEDTSMTVKLSGGKAVSKGMKAGKTVLNNGQISLILTAIGFGLKPGEAAPRDSSSPASASASGGSPIPQFGSASNMMPMMPMMGMGMGPGSYGQLPGVTNMGAPGMMTGGFPPADLSGQPPVGYFPPSPYGAPAYTDPSAFYPPQPFFPNPADPSQAQFQQPGFPASAPPAAFYPPPVGAAVAAGAPAPAPLPVSPPQPTAASQLTPQQLEHARSEFAVSDADKSGLLDHAELNTLLQRAFQGKMEPALIERLSGLHFSMADRDKSGSIDFNEFLEIYAKITKELA